MTLDACWLFVRFKEMRTKTPLREVVVWRVSTRPLPHSGVPLSVWESPFQLAFTLLKRSAVPRKRLIRSLCWKFGSISAS